jgi:hypothetical protein
MLIRIKTNARGGRLQSPSIVHGYHEEFAFQLGTTVMCAFRLKGVSVIGVNANCHLTLAESPPKNPINNCIIA